MVLESLRIELRTSARMNYLVEDDGLESCRRIAKCRRRQGYFISGSLSDNAVSKTSTLPDYIKVSTLDAVLQVGQTSQIATVHFPVNAIESGANAVDLALVAGRLAACAATVPCGLETTGA